MEFKFSKGEDEKLQAETAGEKKSQSAILVLLLLMVGGFSYVYFFTGIIKPQVALKPAETPVKAQIVKMPLPPPPGGGELGKVETKPADVKKEAAVPVKAEPPKTPVAAVAPVAKTPLPPPVKTNEEPQKVEPAKPKEEPRKAGTVKPAERKPVVADSKPVVAGKKYERAKVDVKKVAVPTHKSETAPSKTEKPAKAESNEAAAWSVFVGTYILEDALSSDLGRVRKAGLDPLVKPGAHKKSVMNRLFLSEFTDRADALAALDKLKRYTSDAFILDQGGKHAVYAGSYLLDARAASEAERLSSAGFSVTTKRAEVSIPSRSLSLGPFSDKKTAEAALSKLKNAGVKAVISRQ